jgi:hypothetical protein
MYTHDGAYLHYILYRRLDTRGLHQTTFHIGLCGREPEQVGLSLFKNKQQALYNKFSTEFKNSYTVCNVINHTILIDFDSLTSVELQYIIEQDALPF